MPTRFNPPPNWPSPPPGWTPPPGWRPDPAWPPPPQGWQLWVEDPPAPGPMEQGVWAQRPMAQGPMDQGPMSQGPMSQRPMEQGPWMQQPMAQGPMAQGPWMQQPMAQGPVTQSPAARGLAISREGWWMLGGGAAVLIGSVLPWISATVSNSTLGVGVSGLSYQITSGARAGSAVFGVVLIGLGLAMQSKAARGTFVKPKAYGYAVPFIVLSALGLLGYALFTVVGIAGFNQNDPISGTDKVTFTPSVGLILMLLGSLAALIGGIKAVRQAPRQ